MFVHVLGSFQVYTVPVFDMIEKRILMSGYDNSYLIRMICRYAYVILITFVAITIPVSSPTIIPHIVNSLARPQSRLCAHQSMFTNTQQWFSSYYVIFIQHMCGISANE